MPVVPLPLDGLRISTTLQIPIDTKRLQDFLAPTTGRPSEGLDDDSPVQQPPAPTRTTVTQVPTQTQPPKSSPQPPSRSVAPTN